MHCKSPNTTRNDSATQVVAGILRSHLLPTSHAYIVITHDIDSAIRIADTIWVLGRDFDAQGQPIPGARIQSTIDLIGLGLAWHQDIASTPEFFALSTELKRQFARL